MEKIERDRLNADIASLRYTYQPGLGPHECNDIIQDFAHLEFNWRFMNEERCDGALEVLHASEINPKRIVKESERIRRYYRQRQETITNCIEDAQNSIFQANGMLDGADNNPAQPQAEDRQHSTAHGLRVACQTNLIPTIRDIPEGPSR